MVTEEAAGAAVLFTLVLLFVTSAMAYWLEANKLIASSNKVRKVKR